MFGNPRIINVNYTKDVQFVEGYGWVIIRKKKSEDELTDKPWWIEYTNKYFTTHAEAIEQVFEWKREQAASQKRRIELGLVY